MSSPSHELSLTFTNHQNAALLDDLRISLEQLGGRIQIALSIA